MTAETIAKALDGRRVGAAWMAKCPVHDDCQPSLSLRDAPDGKVLVRCHAGCEQLSVVAALRSRGLWGKSGQNSILPKPPFRPLNSTERIFRPDSERIKAALSIWRCAGPAGGTPVETYLRSRALRPPLPSTLRFHQGLKHPEGGVWPAMVSLVTRGHDDTPTGIHRTFLSPDGRRKAEVQTPKMMLGPCRGGAVRLAIATKIVMVGEGIETCLSAMQATGLPAWAGLSTSGLCALDLPTGIRDVIVLADGDEAGETAARYCAHRWRGEKRRVRIARPPRGLDFNDVLLGIGEGTLHEHGSMGGAYRPDNEVDAASENNRHDGTHAEPAGSCPRGGRHD
jgi:putative DNA primase/helicase